MQFIVNIEKIMYIRCIHLKFIIYIQIINLKREDYGEKKGVIYQRIKKD